LRRPPKPSAVRSRCRREGPTSVARFPAARGRDRRAPRNQVRTRGAGETFVLVELREVNVEVTPLRAGPSRPRHRSLRVDASTDQNAISAATPPWTAQRRRLRQRRRFDTQALVVVPPTTLDARSRDDVKNRSHRSSRDTASVRHVVGDGARDQTSGPDAAMIVLSDGDTTRIRRRRRAARARATARQRASR